MGRVAQWLRICLQSRKISRPGLYPWVGKTSGEGNGNPLQYSCLRNPMDRSLVGYSPWGSQKRHNLATKQQQNWNNFQEALFTLPYRAHSRLFFCFISFFQVQLSQCLGSQPTVWKNLLSYSLPFFLITCNSLFAFCALCSDLSPFQLWNRPSPVSMVISDQWVCLKRSG